MKKKFLCFLILSLIIILTSQVALASNKSLVIPTFKITAVDRNNSVTIKAQNFPANDVFKVRMGAYGTLGIGGVVVGTQNSGSGSFTATYTIPGSLAGSTKIAIRLQSPTSGYYSYNWFWNNDYPSSNGGTPSTSWGYPPAGANTIPNTTVTNVNPGVDVTVQGKNFTTTDSYNVYIGKFGTKGVGGIKVDVQATNANGKFTGTYSIPASLKNEAKLAIRFVSPAAGYYAYDWFYNQGTPTTPTGSGYPPAGPNTIPTFTITAVVKGEKVTIKAKNFTTNDSYKVYMGAMGTKGVGGVVVTTQSTDATGAFTATYSIPTNLKNNSQIAIRLQSPTTGYYSYNWFWNNDYP
jgi:hypothetical protein